VSTVRRKAGRLNGADQKGVWANGRGRTGKVKDETEEQPVTRTSNSMRARLSRTGGKRIAYNGGSHRIINGKEARRYKSRKDAREGGTEEIGNDGYRVVGGGNLRWYLRFILVVEIEAP